MENKQKKDKEPIRKELNSFHECEKLRDEYLAGWQRAKADLINYKKEETSKVGQVAEFVKADLLLQILQVYDNLELAKEHLPKELENNDWVKGMMQVESQFKNILTGEGLKEIESLGQKFNPELHEVVEKENQDDREEGSIKKVIQKGYKLNGKVIRPAKVKIN